MGGAMTEFIIPIKLPSIANMRGHWSKKARIVKAQRTTVGWYLRTQLRPALPVAITITRIAPRMYDKDNNVASLKATIDAIAEWLNVDDRDPRITWTYAQERGAPKAYAVRIEVRS